MRSSFLPVNALLFLTVAATVNASPESMSVEEFETYLKGKLPGIAAADAAKIAALCDLNDDGEIDDEEFADRMSVVQNVMSNPAPAEAVAPDAPVTMSDYMDGNPKVLPPLVGSTDATVLLITGGEIADAWVPFAKWKTRQGRATKIMTVRDIAHSFKGESIQDKIRFCIAEHIENNGTRWVVLGGDCVPGGGIVPGGPITVHEMEPDGIPTDYAYLSSENWDADGDGIVGEWKDDADKIAYPDASVGLGRVPVRTAEDVAAFTAKVIAYESNYPTDGFAEEMLFTSADERSSKKVAKAWDSYIALAWNGKAKRMFVGEVPTLSAESLVEALNAETSGKVHIHGHGELNQWILEGSMFRSADVAKLTNDGAYPIVTTVSCNTGEYDSSSDPSIVESMIRQPRAGSVAVIAPIRTGKMHFHNDGDFDLMISEGKLDGSTMLLARYWIHAAGEHYSVGHALSAARVDLAADAKKSAKFHLCLSEFNLLGDPTLSVHAAAPKTPTVTAPKRAPVGASTLTIESTAPFGSVCVWKGLEVYATAELDSNGNADLEIAPETAGELLVTVTGRRLNAATTTVDVR